MIASVREALNSQSKQEVRAWMQRCTDAELDEFIDGCSATNNYWVYATTERDRRAVAQSNAEVAKQHAESIQESRRQHAKTQQLAKWGLVVGVGALLVGLIAFCRDWFPEAFRPAPIPQATSLSTSSPVSLVATSAIVQGSMATSAPALPPPTTTP